MSEDQLLCKLGALEANLELIQTECNRLIKALKESNAGFEEYERRYYLENQKNEELKQQVETLKAAGKVLLDVYDNEHPIRTADFHIDCNCNRCKVDQIRNSF